MPVFEVTLSDGRTFEVESDAPPSEADVMAALPSMQSASAAPQEQSASGLPETIQGVRFGAPAAIRSMGRFAANHPAGVQKVIATGMTGIGSAIGGTIGTAIGGVPGAVGGAMTGATAKGLTPTQANIREWAGRAMGESAEVAKQAGRAQGIQEYIKNTSGLKVKPSDILERAHGIPAAEKYAQSEGRELLKILGPDEKVVVGPTAQAAPKAASRVGGAVKTGARGVGRILSAISGPMAMTDLAQTVEPTRQDIGVMGIGKSVPNPDGSEPTFLLDEVRKAILSKLGY